MTIFLTGSPKLPVLSMREVGTALTQAELGPSFAAAYTGFSRVHMSQLLSGRRTAPSKPTVETVSMLGYRVLRALKHGYLPHDGHRLAVHQLMHDDQYDTPLSMCSPQDVLPPNWLNLKETLREQDATV